MTIESSLDSGERLLWSGRPDRASYAERKSWPTFLVGIPFLAFALFWTYMASNGPMPMALFGIPFIAVGLALVLSPAWHFLRARQTSYALTARRAILNTEGMMARRTSLPLSRISFVELRLPTWKFGDVVFFEVARGHYDYWADRRDGFIAIADAARVERLLR